MSINRLNGWRRLWLVATGLAVILFGLIYPFLLSYMGEATRSDWLWYGVYSSAP